jgi:hypothetical protein
LFPTDQIEELKGLFGNVSAAEEGGMTYFFIPSLGLPSGCTPPTVDALLCPTNRDGYNSRLFYAERIQSPIQRNWNANGIRILERNWHAFSWQVPEKLRLAQMIGVHLKGLR